MQIQKIEIQTQTNKQKMVVAYLELSADNFSSSSSLKEDREERKERKQRKGAQRPRQRVRIPVDDPHAHQIN